MQSGLWHPQDAEDATQEILLRIALGVSTFRGESAVKTWVFRVATNHLLNVRRSRVETERLTFASFGRDLLDGVAELPAPPTASPDHRLLEEEVKVGCTQAMLLCLDRDERVAYVLGDVFELRSDEAGAVLGVDAAAYRKRLSRARARLRDFMRTQCGLVSEAAPCACARRVPRAIARGRVDPDHLLFAGHGTSGPRRLPVLEAVGEMEHLYEIAAIYHSHPVYAAPERMAAEVRRLIESGDLRVLS